MKKLNRNSIKLNKRGTDENGRAHGISYKQVQDSFTFKCTCSDAVKKSMPIQSAITPAKLKQVIKSAITDDNWLKKFMIFELEEEKSVNEELIDDEGMVPYIFYYIKLSDKLGNSIDNWYWRQERKRSPQNPQSLQEERRISAVSHNS